MVNKIVLMVAITILSFLSFLAGRLHGQEPPKPPTIEELQAKVKAQDARIASLLTQINLHQKRFEAIMQYFQFDEALMKLQATPPEEQPTKK